jgi:hypothetical protein
MAEVTARGTVKHKEKRKEKPYEGADHTEMYYYLFVRFKNPETGVTSTEKFVCNDEYQYNQYYNGDSIDLRRKTNKFLGLFSYSWEIAD